MSKSSFSERERIRIEKLYRFQLPNIYKKVGWILVITAFALMLIRKLADVETEWIKELLKIILLIGFLQISISKEKIEDEFIEMLRAKSYRIAFVLSVLYALVQPYIVYFIRYVIDSDLKTENRFSYFQLLTFMLIVQIGFFYQLKKMNT